MKQATSLSVVLLSALLAGCTWYATLMPFWSVQSGQKGSKVFYSQGMGLWLNYTEHVGDPTFDPGNSLWVPPQDSAVHTYATQCQDARAFCVNAIGDLHIQYCEVAQVYCGAAMKFLQIAMALLSGASLLALVWAVMLVTTTRRTVIDYYLMQLCIFNGLSFLVVATVWYFTFFRVVLNTSFYKDQFTRCSENPTNRSCWHIGFCVYLLVGGAMLYPMLSVVVATVVTNKFKQYQRSLRKLYDKTTSVDLPSAQIPMDTRVENIQQGVKSKTKSKTRTKTRTKTKREAAASSTSASGMSGTELEATATARPLKPLQRVPSAVNTINFNEIEGIQVLSDDEQEEKEREDAIKYGESREFIVQSPLRRTSGSSGSFASNQQPPPAAAAAHPTTAAEPKDSARRSSKSDRKKLKNIKSIEF